MKMRVYKCDSCNKVITDPYTVNMREFYLGFDADCLGLIGIAIPFECKRKIKIHLCDDCFKGLHVIAERSVKSNGKKTDIDYDCNRKIASAPRQPS